MASLSEQLKWVVTADANQAIAAFKKVGDTADKELGNAQSRLDKVGSGMTKFGVTSLASAAVVGTALVKAAGSFEDLALAAAKFSASSGLSIEASSKWIEVAGDIGISTETISGSFNKMEKALGKTPAKFAEYGVAIAKAKDGTTDVNQTFLNVVDALGRIDDPIKRNTASTALLGKSWTDVALLVQQGSTSLQASLDNVDASKTITPAEAQTAKEYQASLDSLHDSVEALTLSVGKGAAPVIGAFADGIGKAISAVSSLDNVTGGAVGTIATIATVGIGAAGALTAIAGKAIKLRDSLTSVDVDGVRSMTNLSKGLVTAGIVAAGAGLIYNALSEDKERVTAITDDFTAALQAEAAGQKDATSAAIANRIATGTIAELAEKAGISTVELADVINGKSVPAWDALKQAIADSTSGPGSESLYARNKALGESMGLTADEAGVLFSRVNELAGAMGNAQHDSAALTAAQNALKGSTGATATAAEVASFWWNKSGTAVQDLKVGTEAATIATDRSAQAAYQAGEANAAWAKQTDEAKRSSDNLSASLAAQRKASQDLIDTELSAIDKKYAARKADGDALDAQVALVAALNDKKRTMESVATATDNAFDATLAATQADLAAKGVALDSKAGIDGQADALFKLAGTLDANSPLRTRLLEYIRDLQNIPTTISTTATFHTSGNFVSGDTAGAKGKNTAGGGPVRAGEAYLVGDGPGGVPTPWSEIFVPSTDGTILTAPQTRAAMRGQSRATGGSTGGLVQNVSYVSTPSSADSSVASLPGASADDVQREQDRIQAAMYKTGRISLAAYRDYARGRMALAADLSDDWLTQYDLINQLNDAEQKANDDKTKAATDAVQADKDAADALLANQDEVQAAMFATGAISQQAYTEYLAGRLGSYQQYSQDWLSIWQQIKQLNDQQAAEQKQAAADQKAAYDANRALEQQAIKDAYDHAQAIKALSDAQANEAAGVNDVLAAGAEGGRIQNDRNATAADRAQATEDLVDAENKVADDAYRTILAGATAETLDVGSVEWDRYMRRVLQASIDGYTARGFGITAAALSGYLTGIPNLAKGGIIQATPGGTLVRAGEAGRDEAIVPLGAGGFGGDTFHIHLTAQSLTGKIDPRTADMLVEAITQAQRRNGRASLSKAA
jgi:hypothetical protein